MQQIKLITIKQNNFTFNKTNHYNNILQFGNDIAQYLEEKTIDISDMMETIVVNIGLTQDLIGETIKCYETDKYVYQLCFVSEENNHNIDESTINYLASYLSGEKVYGTAIILNSLIVADYTCIPDSVTIPTLIDIAYKKFVHKAICVSNGETEPIEYEYLKHPIEYYNCPESEYDKYKSIDVKFLNLGLTAYVESETPNDFINKRATCILNQKVNGNVIFILKSTDEYHDLDLITFNKIAKLASNKLSIRELTDDEKEDDKKINGLPINCNKYCILEKRYNDIKMACNHCNAQFNDQPLICTGCYRIRYDSVECQKNDWFSHKKECLFNHNPINK